MVIANLFNDAKNLLVKIIFYIGKEKLLKLFIKPRIYDNKPINECIECWKLTKLT